MFGKKSEIDNVRHLMQETRRFYVLANWWELLSFFALLQEADKVKGWQF